MCEWDEWKKAGKNLIRTGGLNTSDPPSRRCCQCNYDNFAHVEVCDDCGHERCENCHKNKGQ